MINIAIDGPAGAGKSTIARAAAKALGYIYVDTGALYRTVALAALEAGKNPKEEKDLCPLLPSIRVRLGFADGEQHVFLNERDVSGEIRTPAVSMAASQVSAQPAVRAFLLDLQRQIAAQNNCIMDGRDIGTVVLPQAKVKIFLTASPECRARRRYRELLDKGMTVEYGDVLRELEERDYNDSHREIAPLKPSEESVIADTSDKTLEESIDYLISLIKERI